MLYTTPDQVAEARAADEAQILPAFAQLHGLDLDDEDWPEDKRAEFSRLASELNARWDKRMAAVS